MTPTKTRNGKAPQYCKRPLELYVAGPKSTSLPSSGGTSNSMQVGRWITVASKDGRELEGRAMVYQHSSSGLHVNSFMMRNITQQHGNTKIYLSAIATTSQNFSDSTFLSH